MTKRISTQIHFLQRILSLGNEHPSTIGFTLDDIARWPVFKKRNVPRKSIHKAAERFVKLGILSSVGINANGKNLYRIRRIDWANAYIERSSEKPWIPLTPTPENGDFSDYDEHRDHFDIELTREWFERVRGHCVAKNGQHTLRTKAFTLSINEKSLKGQLFIRAYWRSEVKKYLGDEFYDYVVRLEGRGAMRGDFCVPIDVKGARFYIGGRPTQISASHYEAQLDVRRCRDDDHIKDGLLGLINQADFNTRILDHIEATQQVLAKQNEVQTRILEQLEKITQKMTPETEYHPIKVDGGDYSYG